MAGAPHSLFLNALRHAIAELRQGSGMRTLQVHLAASLFGGTGSGMLVDVAHLVRAIANIVGVSARISAYLVLPQAFEELLPASSEQRGHHRACAFAALRELCRFTIPFDHERGYPVFYAEDGRVDPILRGYIRSTLFDFVYLFDGRRQQYPLHHVPPHEGVAPTIAEVITTMVDDQTGTMLDIHATNVAGERWSRQFSTDRVTVGTVGTYSLVLPIHDIIEGWAHALAHEVLEVFLQPKRAPSQRGMPNRLADDRPAGQSGLSGREAALRFWQKSWIGEVPSTPLQQDLGYIGAESQASEEVRQEMISRLAARSLDEWLHLLMIGLPENADVDQTHREVEMLLQQFLHPQRIRVGGSLLKPEFRYAVVHTSGTARIAEEKRQPALAAARIEQQVAQFFAQHLGRISPTGERVEGKFRWALERYAGWQVAHFRLALEAFTRDTLNGTAADDSGDAIENKAGKLSHLYAALEAIAEHLDGARGAIDEARAAKYRTGQYADIQRRCEHLRQKMRRNWRQQQDYLQACQELLELERWDVAARIVRDAADEMLALVESLRRDVHTWIQALATDSRGMLALLEERRARLEADRLSEKKSRAVREVIYDPAWEEQRYTQYTTQGCDAVAEVLADLHWEVKSDEGRDSITRELRPFLRVRLLLSGTDEDRAFVPEPVERNLSILLDRCHQVFSDVPQRESISAYLIDRYDGSTEERTPRALAERLRGRAGPPLEVQERGHIIPYAYLRVALDPHLPWQQEFYTRLVNHLAEMTGLAPAHNVQIIASDDRFSLTLLNFHELIDLEQVTAFQECAEAYLSQDMQHRQIQHVFPSEVNAVSFETQLGELLPPRIVGLLENIDLFRLFVASWVYGRSGDKARLLHLYTFADETEVERTVWRLTLVPEPEPDVDHARPPKEEHYWLTDPHGVPFLIDACEAFTLGGEDRLQRPNEQRPIPFDRVLEQVKQAEHEDLQQRLESGRLGELVSEYHDHLAKLRGMELDRAQTLVAGLEARLEASHQVEALISELATRSADDDGAQFELRFAKLVRVVLEDEMRKQREALTSLCAPSERPPGIPKT
jgi:hypothetical protein